MNELDRILAEIEAAEPSAKFTARVMMVVREESETRALTPTWLLIVAGLFLVFVGIPIVILTVEGFQSLGVGDGLSTRLFWFLGVLVITSIAAVLPMQLLES